MSAAAPTDSPSGAPTPSRLHPRVRLVWVGGALVVAGVAGLIGLAALRFAPGDLPPAVGPGAVYAVAAAVGALGVAHALIRYHVWRYTVDEDALYLQRGVLTRVETAVPYVRVQHIDTRRGPVERLAGLSSVVVYTAGSRGADVTVPGLGRARARHLRDRLRDLAVAAEAGDAV